jgi:flagellar basal-body rod modification protein FlgD
MNVNGISGGASASPGTGAAPRREVGKDDFLKLLVTQLANQNPLEPMDGTGFVTQLAQFSSLEQLSGVNERLESLSTAQMGMISGQAVGLVGHTVRYEGNSVQLEEGGTAALELELAAPADADVVIRDESGAIVRTMHRDGLQPGRRSVAWDGRDDRGEQLPAGRYTFEVKAADEAGNPVSVSTFSRGRVDGVSYQTGVPRLMLGNTTIELAEVIEVL